MAISRSLMNRQLQANGGIMQVAPREKFGLGSKLKKFARKIIPNEIADIAVKAAPFVAPFNPAVAAAMSGIGTFDQTGSISAGLKSGAMNYGGGQLARYAGGAGFQGNPFGDGGAFTGGLQGFKGGFSSPIGTETGLGKFFSNRGTTGVEGVNETITPTNLNDYSGTTTEIIPTNLNDYAGTEIIPTNLNDYAGTATEALVDASDMSLVGDVKQAASQEFNLFKTAADKVKDFDYSKLGNKALELGKKFGKAAFTNKDGSIDKAAVMGAIAFAGSYAEARALAADAGVDITEETYDEIAKGDKQEEYASYLTNFFGGKKDGGRIGFADGTPDEIMEQFYESNDPDANKSTYTLEDFDITREPEVVLVENYGPEGIKLEKMLKSDAIKYGLNIVADSIPPGLEGEVIDLSVFGKKDGGRIGLKFGSKPEEAEVGIMTIDVETGDDEDEEDMEMAAGISFNSAEKSYLFKKLGGAGGTDRSYTMPQLFRILNSPGSYPNDSAILKQITINAGLGKKDGGRIGLKDGTDESLIEKLLNSKIAQEGRYGASEFFFGDPIMFGTPDKFKDGKNDNRGTFKRDSSDYDKLSPEKQAYIEAFLNSDEGQLFLKPGKIRFPINEKMREHNKKIRLEDFNEDRNPLELLLGIDYENRAKGGRIGYKGGANRVSELLILRDQLVGKGEDVSDIEAEIFQLTGKTFKSVGGISDVPTGQMRKNNAGVVERDYRDEGGFVPVGIKERADDVPAMLSKNEFVMTADAVRGIGNGSVEEGSKKLYNTMKQAEKVGKA